MGQIVNHRFTIEQRELCLHGLDNRTLPEAVPPELVERFGSKHRSRVLSPFSSKCHCIGASATNRQQSTFG